jgi:hypothetical protein
MRGVLTKRREPPATHVFALETLMHQTSWYGAANAS